MKRRVVCALLSIFMFLSVFPCFSASAMTILNSYSATINGVKITKDSYPGQKNCWKYANGIYKKIWGSNFTSDFVGSKETDYNMLRDMTADNRKISLSTVKKYVSAAPLGAVIRVCRTSSTAYSDGSDGHNLILAGKSDTGYYFFEDWGAGNSGYNAVSTFYTFNEFATYFPNSKKYYYFKYIKWPDSASVSMDYYVKFNANGGSGAPAKQGKDKNSDITLSEKIPVREDYAFAGWAEQADATEPIYFANSKFSQNKNLTLYAVWKKASSLGNSFTAKIRNPKLSKYITTESDGNVASYSANNKNSQLWTFTKQSDGSYKVKNKANGYNLSITYAVSTVGGNVKSYYASDSPAQNWFLVKSGSGYLLYSKCTDKPLEIADNQSKNGINIETDLLSTDGSQVFSIIKDISSPIISEVKISSVNYQSFIVSGKITDNKAVGSAKICTYTTENAKDDAITENLAVAENGSFSYTVKRSKHKFDYGEYSFTITAYDSSYNYINYTSKAVIPAQYTPKETVQFGSHFYSLYDISLSFEKAQSYAKSLGGHLVTINSADEQKAIFNSIEKIGLKSFYWIGAKDNEKDNKFNWVTSESFSYTNWAKGEPSNVNEQYGFMYRNAVNTAKPGQWADISNYGGANSSSPYYLTNYGFIVEYDSLPTPKVSGITATKSGLQIAFSGTSIATGYEVYRKLSSEKSFVKVASVSNQSSLKYLDTKVKDGGTYYYNVKSVRNGISSLTTSNCVNNTFVKQVNFSSLKKSSSSSAKLIWKKSNGVDGYKIYRKTGNGKFKLIKTVSNTVGSFLNIKLKKKTNYTYRVRAYKKVGNSTKYGAYSAEKRIKLY